MSYSVTNFSTNSTACAFFRSRVIARLFLLNEEEDELENVAKEMKTKSGYLKDDFVVEDNLVEDVSGSDEGTWEDETSELDYEEYSYSDED